VSSRWDVEKRDLAREVITTLYREGLFGTWLRDRPEGWELISGNWSPFYISMRSVPSRPHVFRLLVKAISRLIENEVGGANRLLGLATTAIPLAAGVAYAEGIPMSFTRKLPNVRSLEDLERDVALYGGHSLVEGDFTQGDRVAILDDVVNLFDSKEIAVRQLELEMAKRGIVDVDVEAIVVVVDRGRESNERADAAGLRLASLLSFRHDGFEMLRGVASEREIEVLQDYMWNFEKYQDPAVRQQLIAEAAPVS
jgi:orotate phosphoribosyltransferase